MCVVIFSTPIHIQQVAMDSKLIIKVSQIKCFDHLCVKVAFDPPLVVPRTLLLALI